MSKKLTPAEKAKATRDAKLSKAMEDLGFERKKVTRKRKPMSEEQRKLHLRDLPKQEKQGEWMVVNPFTLLFSTCQKTIGYTGRK